MRRRRVTFRAIDRGALVRLPPVFDTYLAFRRTFPRALPMRRLFSFVVLGPFAMSRVGAFDQEHGDAALAEIRRRERALADAEWRRRLERRCRPVHAQRPHA